MLLLLFLIVQNKAAAQSTSNEGTDFWAVFPTHVSNGNAFAKMTVFISSKYNSSGKIVVAGQIFPFTVKANIVEPVDIPRDLAYIKETESELVIRNRGIHITVDAGKPPIAVYGHVYASARSEAYLILPVDSHGKKYFSMNATGEPAENTLLGGVKNGMSYIVVVATANNTVIKITRPGETTAEKITLLYAGDVYETLSVSDLTGTTIEIDESTSSCKTFAAFSGHSGIGFSGSASTAGISYDPLLQQLYSVENWGTTYGLVPFFNRAYFAKFIAMVDNTKIWGNGVLLATLQKGKSFTLPRENNFMYVNADKPISVAQFAYSQKVMSDVDPTALGDPEMVILNPIEYSIKNVTLFSSNFENIEEKYINVFMKTKYRSSFKINGSLPGATWQTSSNPEFSYLQLKVTEESLTLSADAGFNAIAYGFGSAESYGYSAGTNLATNRFVLLQNKVTNEETSAACAGQASDLKLTVPYLLTRIHWRSADGTVDYIDANPAPTQKVIAGQIQYTYYAPINKTFTTIGQFQLTASVSVAQSEGTCFSGELDLVFLIDVDPLPTAIFSAVTEGCTDTELLFTDQSVSNVPLKLPSKWLWDFGDGNTSTEQNPRHAYAASGSFQVKLMVAAENGCWSDVSLPKAVQIKPKVKASFQASKTTCIQTNVLFTDQSSVESGTIDTWIWDMGDGKGLFERKNATPFNYKFETAGTYKIKLLTVSAAGCTSLPFEYEITVTELPKIDFKLPAVCVSDLQANFSNETKDLDGSTAGLTYLWDFGDPASGAANTSTDRDGKHHYQLAKTYTVKLTVTNVNGCVNSAEKPLTVNGANIVAKCSVPNKNQLCSNTSFTVLNQSTVDAGNITSIEWFINDVKQDIDPTPQPSYQLSVPASATDLTLNLKMIVYSGATCSEIYLEPPFAIKASPVVEMLQQSPICLNAEAAPIVAKELNGLVGTAKFTGKGISADGIFDPQVAGAGEHEITYSFIATNGCSDSKTQTITVFEMPTADAGIDQYVLLGGEKQLRGNASGNALTYKWTPSIGLNRDDILNPIVKPESDVTYTLTVTTENGCTAVDEVDVHVINLLNAPNSFSPNGDGINDVWNIKYLDSYPKVSIEIFNRNGQRIYYSKGYSVPFDGKYNNQVLPVGTYYYIINPNSGGKSISGNLTIIR